MRNFILSLFLVLAAIYAPLASGSESQQEDTGRVLAQIGSDYNVVAPGQEFNVALYTIIDPKWHTYWYNPGDSGEPVQIDWVLPEELSAGDIIWPLPAAIPTGPLVNYGFEDGVVFPVPFQVSPDAKPGDVLTIDADIYYLVCEEICVPEDTQLSISVIVGAPEKHGRWDDLIRMAKAEAPAASDVSAGMETEGETLILRLADLPEGDFIEAYFFPWEQGVMMPSEPQRVSVGSEGIEIRSKPGGLWKKGKPERADGVLRFMAADGPTGVKVSVSTEDMPEIGTLANEGVGSNGSNGIWFALFGAFLGGLILNIMPCVFPVISLKALSIAKLAHGERRAIRRDAWAYTLGVLFTFLILVGLVIALRSAGTSVGWGFQLQSPVFIGLMTLLLFMVSLNLLGFLEIAGGFQNFGQSLTDKNGAVGSFFTGALAVVVATPCTAPFMAGSVGWAFAQPPMTTLIVFMALGLGFAFPFLLLGYVPFVARILPKPGPWMVRFKEFLAFPVLLAVAILIWVLSNLSGSTGILWMCVTLVLAAMAIWVLKLKWRYAWILAGLLILSAIFIPFQFKISQDGSQTLSLTESSMDEEGAYYGVEWSPENVQTLRQQGYAVFVDFTASWCVNCKVNEITVLKTKEIKEVFRDTKTAFLIADWTKPDDRIAAELEKYGRAGIPFYQLFPPGNNDVRPELLPQTLTKSMIREKLEGIRN